MSVFNFDRLMLFLESVTWIQIDYGNITSNRTKEHQLRALITTGGGQKAITTIILVIFICTSHHTHSVFTFCVAYNVADTRHSSRVARPSCPPGCVAVAALRRRTRVATFSLSQSGTGVWGEPPADGRPGVSPPENF